MGLTRRLTSAGLALLALSVAPLAAQAQQETVALVYRGDQSCPPAEAFQSALLARTDAVRFGTGDEGHRMIRVRVATTGARAQGKLEVELPQGVSRVREIHGETCADVVDALAVVAALTIESTPASPGAFPPTRRQQPADERVANVGSTANVEVAVGAPVLAVGGPAPGLMWGVGAFVEVATGLVAGRGTIVHLPPSHTPEALATFSATGGRVEGCFPRLEAAGVIAAFPCLGLEAAWLRGAGDVGRLEHANKAWVDALAAAHFEIGLLSTLWFDGQAALAVPFTHYSYDVANPDAVLYETPVVAATFGFGIGARIP